MRSRDRPGGEEMGGDEGEEGEAGRKGKDVVEGADLAGAKAVQVVSALYRKGKGQLGVMLAELEDWMKRHKYKSIDQFRGKLSQKESTNPATYERVQFMQYFGAKK
jgi:hypothetical protein